jgi:hypothetical protein
MNGSRNGVAAIIARQDGVIARRQAQELGMSPAQIRHQVATGSWQRVQPISLQVDAA